MRVPRVHVLALPTQGEVEIPAQAAHHLRGVLRLAPGAPLVLFDGHGHAARATLVALERSRALAAVEAPLDDESGESHLRLVLAIAPLKGDALAWVVEKATELGVDEIRLVETHRTDRSALSALSSSRLERLRRIAVSAAEQSERSRVPILTAPATLERALQAPVAGPRLICAERSAHPWPASPGPVQEALLLVGPHGGWTDDELAMALSAGCQPLSLGPRILRAETAALAALTLAQATWGDVPKRT